MDSDAKGHWENDARCLAAACIFDFVISRPESDLAGFVSGKKKQQLGIWTLALFGKFTRAVTQEGGALVEKRSERDLNLGKHDIIDPRTTGKSR